MLPYKKIIPCHLEMNDPCNRFNLIYFCGQSQSFDNNHLIRKKKQVCFMMILFMTWHIYKWAHNKRNKNNSTLNISTSQLLLDLLVISNFFFFFFYAWYIFQKNLVLTLHASQLTFPLLVLRSTQFFSFGTVEQLCDFVCNFFN